MKKPPDAWQQWKQFADDDLATAELLLREGGIPAHVAFHAQQCVEKVMKAVITAKGADIPRSHDLTRLLRLALGKGEDSAALVHDMGWLSQFAVDARYPGPAPVTTKSDGERSLAIARDTLAVCSEYLK